MRNAVELSHVSHAYGKTRALKDVSLTLPVGDTVGLIGPDGVGKSTLLALIAGVKTLQSGTLRVLGEDIADKEARTALSHRIAFMPQGLGQNLYPTLSVQENIEFHARLFGLSRREREARIARLFKATALAPFTHRAAGKLSGGMKQKLSLCCALVHSPELLILDEPTTGVDPLSRRQFWDLVHDLRDEAAEMTVVVATAYIDEAGQFAHLLAMDDGHLLANAPTQEVLRDTGSTSLEEAYVKLLPETKRSGAGALVIPPFEPDPNSPPAMEAEGLTKRFGDFTAVEHVDFVIPKGEIFGFLGSNGCGKSTTMKMLTGLLEPTSGQARLLGHPTDADDMETRKRVGYMSQAFSLYKELTVRQNLVLHAKLYQMPEKAGKAAVAEALTQFELDQVADVRPDALPLGIRQRLQLAAACLHHPEVLILDEPTSGVDPVARDMFWEYLVKLSRQDKITLFVSTHFMNEAMRCDRISLMHQGRVLAVGTPQALCESQNTDSLEQAFIRYLEEAEADPLLSGSLNGETAQQARQNSEASGSLNQAAALEHTPASKPSGSLKVGKDAAADTGSLAYWLATVWTFALRESRELLRDRIRLFFALFGPVLLMMAASVGVSFDMRDIRFAALDRDNTVLSRELIRQFEGSPYFKVAPPLHDDAEVARMLRGGKARMVMEIPAGFGSEVLRGHRPEVAFYIDGALPFTAENMKGFALRLTAEFGKARLIERGISEEVLRAPAELAPRFVYNQDFRSIFAIAPGMIMLALSMIPVMMTALGVVREKEIGSISNLYTSPASSVQFLVGKQLPYIALSFCSYLILVWMAVVVLGVPVQGGFVAMSLGAVLQLFAVTALGLLISTFLRSQIAAVFASAIAAVIPAMSFSGMLYPVSTLEGAKTWIAWLFPSAWFQRISLGGFTKGLGMADFVLPYLALTTIALVFIGLAGRLLKKQEQ